MKSKNSDNPIVKRGRGRPKKIKSDAVDTYPDRENTGLLTMPIKRKPKHYIDNAEFERLIREYYRTDIFSEELGEMINKISEHVTYMPRFINYTWHDAMISDSNYKIVKALNERKFDPDRGSAFSYFTRVCINAFFFVTEKERKNHTTIENYQIELCDELSLNGYMNTATDNENHWE